MNNLPKKVLIINLGWEQKPLIDSLIQRGYEIYGITNEVSLEYKGFKKVYHSDYRDLEKIHQIAKAIKPDAVISDQCDYSQYAQAYLCERLSLKGPTLRQAQVSSNKYVQRKLAAENGVRIPNFELATSLDEARIALTKIGLPAIIKPIDNRGSFGVSKINQIEELEDAYYNALTNSHSRFVLIEQFINGYEITVDGYCFGGKPKSIAVALKSKEGLTSQVSMDIKYPADIPAEIYKQALVNNEFVANALGFTFGMVHSEYLIDVKNDIYLVESANRGGGVFTSEIIAPKVSGVNILDRLIDDVLDISSEVQYPETIEKNQVILKFFAFKNGKVKAIHGMEKTKSIDGVLACRLNIKIGDIIKTIDNDGSRHGFIIYHSNGNLREEVTVIIKNIEIEYEHE
jgi:biotin carboxylase